MASQQRNITFAGDVQGVGFRYTACRVADRHEMTGYVRNLPDGDVQCLVEGEPAGIDAFLADLRDVMGSHIRNVSQQEAPATGRYASFSVKY